MGKLNWSCTSCGMSSSRRSSVQRHIDNYNIHNGLGQVVSYLEYSIGIKEGVYLPQDRPEFTRSEMPPYLKMIETEVENQIVREIGQRIYKKITLHKQFFDNFEKIATDRLISKFGNDILKSLNLQR